MQNEKTGSGIDLVHFIRSIQRLEGNDDCFARSDEDCDRLDCAWRKWCLEEYKKLH